MKFHLDYNPVKPCFQISHKDKIFLAGSCFAENIGALLRQYHFQTLINHSGILFNPLSIYTSLINCVEEIAPDEKYFIKRGKEHYSYLHHSSVKESSKEKLASRIDVLNKEAHGFLRQTNITIITFGSAHAYEHKELQCIVANCHKQPNQIFEKKLLSVSEIVVLYKKLIQSLLEINADMKIILTVSPVRYLKDGVEENNLSKSTLLLAVKELTDNKNIFYFPAYELVIDDLRDYRFYKEDMAHPNEMAIDYVWEKFSQTFFDNKTRNINSLLLKLNKAQSHRKLHSNPDEDLKLEKYISDLVAEIKKIDSSIKF